MKTNKASVKSASAKASLLAGKTAPKAPVVKSGPEKATVLVAVGIRGCVCVDGFASNLGFRPRRTVDGHAAEFTARIIPEGSFPASWKGKSAESEWGKACGLWVSPAGEKVRLLPLADALKAGTVQAITVKREGGKGTEKVILPGGWKPSQKFPPYVGASNDGGRWETFTHPAGLDRQAGFGGAKLTVA